MPLLLLLGMSSGLACQSTTVVPRIYSTTEANSATAWPFGLGSPCRVQYLYDANAVAVANLSIQAITLRIEGNSQVAAVPGVDLEIRISTSPVAWYAPNTTFAANHGANLTVAYQRKLTNLPALTANSIPATFAPRLPFDIPLVYQRSGGNLLIDYVVYGQPAISPEYYLDTSYGAPFHSSVGNPCGILQAVAGGDAGQPGAYLEFTAHGVTGAATHVLGAARLPSPLPLPLGGCPLHVRPDFVLPMIVTGTTAVIRYPLRVSYGDVVVFGQSVTVDGTVPQLLASQATQTRIGRNDAQARIYDRVSATSLAGTVQVGVGIVTQLSY